ncbi:hypothetical protein ACP_3377 [Acidobacterium capsulatum ATCC 51196]|uniref:ATP-grasp domain-containing protein n=2 Tax=Acidobacteriaceae TaxID=204434 RepID=C1F6E3_ACIC5|nr:hypothetical protein ACP_3377 [Acidobacterium capsulatum ATCC 51196]
MAFLRRCHEAGIEVHLLRHGNWPQRIPLPSNAITTDGGALRWEEINTPAGMERIVAFTQSVQADAICSDDEFMLYWLASHRHRFEPRCTVLASSAEAIARLMEKSEQVQLAREAGFQVLPSWLLHTRADADSVPASSFPLCLRPTHMNSVTPPFKAHRVDSPAELHAFLSTLTWTSPLLAQPFCLGPNLVLHGVRSTGGEVLALECFRAYRKYKGYALSIERMNLPADLRQAAERFAHLANLHGPFHFDLLQSADTGEIFFLEVNYRIGGTTPKVIHLGYDEPMLALAAFGLEPPHRPPALRASRRVTGKRMLAGQIYHTLRHGAGMLDFPQHSRLRIILSGLWEFLTVPDAILSRKDMRGSLFYLRRGGRM